MIHHCTQASAITFRVIVKIFQAVAPGARLNLSRSAGTSPGNSAGKQPAVKLRLALVTYFLKERFKVTVVQTPDPQWQASYLHTP